MWRLKEDDTPVTEVADELRMRMAAGKCETWLSGPGGQGLCVVGNGERAMVMLLEEVDDPGGHAVDPGAEGVSDGYVLGNGQNDQYADADTVPLDDAIRIAAHIVAHGTPPDGVPWQDDRG